MRRLPAPWWGDLAAVVALALIALVVGLSPISGPVRTAALLPLVLILPGYALAAAFFLPGEISRELRGVLSVALSVGVSVLGGLIVQLVLALDRPVWATLLAIVTVLAIGVAFRRRDAMPADGAQPSLRGLWVGVVSAVAVLAAIAIAGGAISIATEGVHRQLDQSRFSSLSLAPHGPSGIASSVTVGVSNHEGRAVAYRVTVKRGTQAIKRWRLRLVAEPGLAGPIDRFGDLGHWPLDRAARPRGTALPPRGPDPGGQRLMLLKTPGIGTLRPSARNRPARSSPSRSKPARRPSLGATPILALVAAGGLVMIALGNNAARDGHGAAPLVFWAGLAAIYAPIAFRLLSRSASRAERIALVALLGVSLFAVRILASPTAFVRFDELGTWRATNDVLQTGHLFSANPLVVSTAGFPGIEVVTAAVAQLTGLSIFHAGLVVLGVARTTLVVALFLFLERATRSARAAGIGVAVYACNPSFLYFDSQFAYESLALMIAAVLLVVAVHWSEPGRRDRPRAVGGMVGAMAVLAATLAITHHMTSYALLTFLVAWAVLTRLTDRKTPAGSGRGTRVAANGGGTLAARRGSFLDGPGLPAVLVGVTAIAWFVFVAGAVTIDELGKVVTGAVDSTLGLVFGGSGPKTLFAGGGQSNPMAARALAVGSVIPLLVLIPLGLRRTWRATDSSALWRTLALATLLYPVSLGLRLTQAGSETSQRASEFVFVGVAFFAGLLVSELRWPDRWLRRKAKALALTAVAVVVFLGGFIIGELPATRQPGQFLVGAEDRSISPQGLAAAALRRASCRLTAASSSTARTAPCSPPTAG